MTELVRNLSTSKTKSRICNHGEKSQCKSRGRTLAHELGHMFSLKHKHDQKTDLMMWGNGIEVKIVDQQIY